MYTEVAAGAAVLLEDHIGLWDWRRRIAELYAEIRAFDDPEIAWRLWRDTRNELFRTHSQSPLEERRRHGFDALALFDYDPAFRCVVDLAPVAEAPAHAVSGGRDGYVQLIPFARTAGLVDRLGDELTLYWLGGYGSGVFLPFRDATTGRATFGGGRYLLMASRDPTSASPLDALSSISTSPTTRPAPIRRAGSVRWRRWKTRCRWRSTPASASPAERRPALQCRPLLQPSLSRGAISPTCGTPG